MRKKTFQCLVSRSVVTLVVFALSVMMSAKAADAVSVASNIMD